MIDKLSLLFACVECKKENKKRYRINMFKSACSVCFIVGFILSLLQFYYLFCNFVEDFKGIQSFLNFNQIGLMVVSFLNPICALFWLEISKNTNDSTLIMRIQPIMRLLTFFTILFSTSAYKSHEKICTISCIGQCLLLFSIITYKDLAEESEVLKSEYDQFAQEAYNKVKYELIKSNDKLKDIDNLLSLIIAKLHELKEESIRYRNNFLATAGILFTTVIITLLLEIVKSYSIDIFIVSIYVMILLLCISIMGTFYSFYLLISPVFNIFFPYSQVIQVTLDALEWVEQQNNYSNDIENLDNLKGEFNIKFSEKVQGDILCKRKKE